jgi:hypothetical protein
MYGKTMENLRRRCDIRIVSEVIAAERQTSKYNCRAWQEINDDFTMIQLDKTSILWNKPTFVGFSVLDLSKLLMYEFHYTTMKPLYGERIKLLFTDTDSLCYEITTKDLYADMQQILDQLDTSDYPADHPLYSRDNCKVIGKFKDECNGIAPVHFVGLRAKMYSLLLPEDHEKLRAKGVKSSFVSRHIRHQDYVNCLSENGQTTASFKTF